MPTANNNPPPAAGPAAPRVVLVADRMHSGGKEGVVIMQAVELARLGCPTAIICIRGGGPFADIAVGHGVQVIELRSRRRMDPATQARLMRRLVKLRPDVINVHDLASLPQTALANRMTVRAPIVFTCHGLLGPRRLRLGEMLALNAVAEFTAVSHHTADRYADLLPGARKPLVIRNGIWPGRRDAAVAARLRSQLGIPDGQFIFLAAGNIKPEKGYEDLLEACRLLAGRPAPRLFRVLIAGDPMIESYWRGLQSQLKRDSLGSVVTFLGLRDDVGDLHSAADAFVLPSRSEGLPMSLLEAMSAGLPVVATAVGGVGDAIGQGAGLLVEPASPAQLADAMLRLMQEPQLAADMAAKAAQVVAARFNAREMAGDYLDLFRRTIGHVVGRATPAVAPAQDGGQYTPCVIARVADASPRPGVLMLGPRRPLVGGMATVVENLCRSALASDCDLSAVHTGKLTSEGRSLAAAFGVQANLLAQVVAQIAIYRPRLVHIHTCSGGTFWRDCLYLVAARLMRRPVIWHIHGGGFAEFARRQWAIGRLAIRGALAAASAIVVLGERTRECLSPLAPAGRWHVVANGVPIPPQAATPDRHDAFLFMGALRPQKGVLDLVQAAAMAFGKGLGGRVELAGAEQEPGQEQALRRRIAELGVGERVRLLGVVAGSAHAGALGRARCVVLPSYIEAMPMVLLEAMAAGLPVIATTVGAVPELIDDGVEGFLISTGDVAALADRMLRLGQDGQLAARMGCAARERIIRQSSVDRMAGKILHIYKKVLGVT